MTTALHHPDRAHRLLGTRLGTYLLAADADGLVGGWRQDQTHFPATNRLGGTSEGPHS